MSLLGFHVASAKRTGAGDLLTAGAPLVVMCDQNMIAEAHHANAIAAFRTQVNGDNPDNFMDHTLDDMTGIAQAWMQSQKVVWDKNTGADFYITNNEQDIGTLDDAAKLNAFFDKCMGWADMWNLHVGICSFSSGNPSDDAGLTLEQRWAPLLPAIQHACERGHAIVLHAHALDSGGLIASGEDLALRHQRTLRYFAAHGLYPKVIIGELSNGVGGIEPNLDKYLLNVEWWDLSVMQSPFRDQVIGGALYGFNSAETITPAVPDLAAWITAHPTPTTTVPPDPDPIDLENQIVQLKKQVSFLLAQVAAWQASDAQHLQEIAVLNQTVASLWAKIDAARQALA